MQTAKCAAVLQGMPFLKSNTMSNRCSVSPLRLMSEVQLETALKVLFVVSWHACRSLLWKMENTRWFYRYLRCLLCGGKIKHGTCLLYQELLYPLCVAQIKNIFVEVSSGYFSLFRQKTDRKKRYCTKT